MSSILKALQRLERDRAGSRENEPAVSGDLSEELTTAAPAARRGQPGLWIGIGLALVVTAAGAWFAAPWLAARMGETPPVVAAAPAPASPPSRELAAAPPDRAAPPFASPDAAAPARSPEVPTPAPARPEEASAPAPAAAPNLPPPAPREEARAPAPETAAVAKSVPAEAAEMPAPGPKVEAPARVVSAAKDEPPVRVAPAPRAEPAPPAEPAESAPTRVAAVPPSEPEAPAVKSRQPEASAAPAPPKATARAEPEARPPTPAPPRSPAPAKPKPRPPASAKPAAPPPASVASAGRAPDITVLRTSWHPTPARRAARVKIAGSDVAREVHEGDTTGALTVVKIEPSAVVFTFQGREVRQAVGKK